MRIRTACFDKEMLWVVDDVIGGLYSVDPKTLETECMIDSQRLFPCGSFKVQSLLKWKKDYIIIIPLEIDRDWIFYNKTTNRIEYRKIIDRNCKERLIAVDQDRNQVYFFPLYIYDPVLIIDLDALKCVKVIEKWSVELPDICFETAWTGAYNGKYVFYPQKDTKILIRINCENHKVDVIEIDILENVIDVNYAFGELWVLPVSGNRLYQVDENGHIVNFVELSVKDVGTVPDFARIVVQKRYLFLLPCYRKGVYVYDRQMKKTHIIPSKKSILNKNEKKVYLRYWEYYIQNGRICFLPFLEEYMEVGLDTLAYTEKRLSYPAIWSNEEKIQNCIQSHISESDSVIWEADGCGLDIFLKYVQQKINTMEFSETEEKCKKIWNGIMDIL